MSVYSQNNKSKWPPPRFLPFCLLLSPVQNVKMLSPCILALVLHALNPSCWNCGEIIRGCSSEEMLPILWQICLVMERSNCRNVRKILEKEKTKTQTGGDAVTEMLAWSCPWWSMASTGSNLGLFKAQDRSWSWNLHQQWDHRMVFPLKNTNSGQ